MFIGYQGISNSGDPASDAAVLLKAVDVGDADILATILGGLESKQGSLSDRSDSLALHWQESPHHVHKKIRSFPTLKNPQILGVNPPMEDL